MLLLKKKRIRHFSLLAHSLITELHAADPNDETFDQLGILDGHSQVVDFLEHDEWGLAIEHVLYMVHESNIDFPDHELKALHALAERLGVRHSYRGL